MQKKASHLVNLNRLYRKRPVVIEAIRFVGGRENAQEILQFTEHKAVWFFNHETISIDTPDGTVNIDIGDWIIKGARGEFYSCKNDTFERTYEQISNT